MLPHCGVQRGVSGQAGDWTCYRRGSEVRACGPPPSWAAQDDERDALTLRRESCLRASTSQVPFSGFETRLNCTSGREGLRAQPCARPAYPWLTSVTNAGNKTGAIRKTPLMRVKDGANYVLVGSMGGAPKHPVWVYNLRANPRVEVRDGAEEWPMLVREVDDETERARRGRWRLPPTHPMRTIRSARSAKSPCFLRSQRNPSRGARPEDEFAIASRRVSPRLRALGCGNWAVSSVSSCWSPVHQRSSQHRARTTSSRCQRSW